MMKNKAISILLCILLCLTGMIQVSSFTTETVETAFTVEMAVPTSIIVGDITKVTLTLGNITTPLSGVEFIFTYDENFLTPVITENANEEMNAFMVKTPPNGWEQVCHYHAETASYSLRFVADDSGTDDVNLIRTSSDFIIEIPFIVTKAGGFNLTVKNNGIFGFDMNTSLLQGLGGTLAATATENINRFNVDIIMPDPVFQGCTTNITITLTNDSDTSGLLAAEFKLYFGNGVEPVVTENDTAQMNTFLTSTPNSSWEQVCSLDEAYDYYTVRLAASNAGTVDTELLHINDKIILTIPFLITGEIDSTSSFIVPTESCIAVNNITKTIAGHGDSTFFSIQKSTNIQLILGSTKTLYESAGEKYSSGFNDNTEVSEMLLQFSNTGLIVRNASGTIITSGICMTGYTLSFYSGDTLLDSVTIIIEGDINGDGKITAVDYLFVKRAFMGTITLNETQLQAAYLKNTTSVTAATYLMIKRHVLGTYNLYA